MNYRDLERTDHRPWPLPDRPWAWRQTWHDLLFAHWPISASELRPLIPPELTLQRFDGNAWLGLVPFRMTGVMRRPLPDLPWISAFAEVNLRTYVELGGKPGVWFLSLDAANPLAVWAARRFFHLPYFLARMEVTRHNGEVRYRSVRRSDPAGLTFEGRYSPSSALYEAEAGDLDHWLTERYCLYAARRDGEIYRTEVHHRPWPLQEAQAEIRRNELSEPHGLTCDDPPVLLHFSRRLDVRVWSPERVGG